MTLTAAPALQRVQRMQWEPARVVPAADMCKNKWKFTWGGIRLFMKAHAISRPSQWKTNKQINNSLFHLKGTGKLQETSGLLQCTNHPTMFMYPYWSSHKPYLPLTALSLTRRWVTLREKHGNPASSLYNLKFESVSGHPRLEWCRICRVFSASWCVFLTNLMVFIAGLCLPAPKCSNLVQQSQSTFLGIAMPWSSPSGPKLSPF